MRSYFSRDIVSARGPRIVAMLREAKSVSIEVTGSVLEALILEAKYIKRYQPIYNVQERDDTSFNYLVVTRETFPRVLVVRGHEIRHGPPTKSSAAIRPLSTRGRTSQCAQDCPEVFSVPRPLYAGDRKTVL